MCVFLSVFVYTGLHPSAPSNIQKADCTLGGAESEGGRIKTTTTTFSESRKHDSMGRRGGAGIRTVPTDVSAWGCLPLAGDSSKAYAAFAQCPPG